MTKTWVNPQHVCEYGVLWAKVKYAMGRVRSNPHSPEPTSTSAPDCPSTSPELQEHRNVGTGSAEQPQPRGGHLSSPNLNTVE